MRNPTSSLLSPEIYQLQRDIRSWRWSFLAWCICVGMLLEFSTRLRYTAMVGILIVATTGVGIGYSYRQLEKARRALAEIRKLEGMHHYILDGHEPVAEEDWMKWNHWMDSHKDQCRVRVSFFGGTEDESEGWVSTVFLGITPSHDREGRPLLFETMIFDCELEGYQERYRTWEEALEGHAQATQFLKSFLATKQVLADTSRRAENAHLN